MPKEKYPFPVCISLILLPPMELKLALMEVVACCCCCCLMVEATNQLNPSSFLNSNSLLVSTVFCVCVSISQKPSSGKPCTPKRMKGYSACFSKFRVSLIPQDFPCIWPFVFPNGPKPTQKKQHPFSSFMSLSIHKNVPLPKSLCIKISF